METNDTALSGMKAICGYVNRSESTVLKMIKEEGFPAKKIGGGIWESDRDLISAWRKKRIMDETEPEKPVLKTPKKKQQAKKGR